MPDDAEFDPTVPSLLEMLGENGAWFQMVGKDRATERLMHVAMSLVAGNPMTDVEKATYEYLTYYIVPQDYAIVLDVFSFEDLISGIQKIFSRDDPIEKSLLASIFYSRYKYSIPSVKLSREQILNVFDSTLGPAIAVAYARQMGASDITRIWALRSSLESLSYAIDVDHGPHDVTREGCCLGGAHWANEYAAQVDRRPHPRTFSAVLSSTHHIFLYAMRFWTLFDRSQKSNMRKAFLLRCTYAEDRDEGSWLAISWSLYIDRRPRNDMRTIACLNAEVALSYASEIDHAPHPQTWEAVVRAGPPWSHTYRTLFAVQTEEDGPYEEGTEDEQGEGG
jgi:hypothetical protein